MGGLGDDFLRACGRRHSRGPASPVGGHGSNLSMCLPSIVQDTDLLLRYLPDDMHVYGEEK